MSEHVAYVVQIKELNKHPNADRLQIATIFGASVIVDLSVKEGDLGVYFPIDLQLSEEYCKINDLVRRKDENGNPAGGYLDPGKRNIRAMRFRGSPSEGLFMPLETLKYTGKTQFEVGEKFDNIEGHEICRKYIPRGNPKDPTRKLGNKSRKKKVPIAPLFAEHADTEQLAYNIDAFKSGDQIEITLKMHGTSGRTGYLPKFAGYYHKIPFIRKLANLKEVPKGKAAYNLYEKAVNMCVPLYNWGYVSGTRRVVLNDFDGGFYGDNSFREPHAKFFEGKLLKGETVYYEIVGFTTFGAPIMGSVSNSKISDKEFSKYYGPTTVFSYGCNEEPIYKENPSNGSSFSIVVPQSDFYVYRMTMTNEDGDIVEYTPDYMRYRCEQMGAKTVPVFWKGYIPEIHDETNSLTPGDYIKEIAEKYYDGPDPVGVTHVREGVVVRIVDRPRFTAYKHKNFNFKVLSGIAADLAAENGDLNNMDEDLLSEL